MKVRCKGYKTCEYKHKCYHSKEHEFLEESINDWEEFFKGANKCEINSYPDSCNCSSVNLRKDKLSKLNDKS